MQIQFKTSDLVKKDFVDDLYNTIVKNWNGEEYTTRKGNWFRVYRENEAMVLQFAGKRSSLLDAKPLPFKFSWSNTDQYFASIWFRDKIYYEAFRVISYYTTTPSYWNMRWYEELIPCKYIYPDQNGWRPVNAMFPYFDAENLEDFDREPRLIPKLNNDINDENCSVIYNRVTRTIRAIVRYENVYKQQEISIPSQ